MERNDKIETIRNQLVDMDWDNDMLPDVISTLFDNPFKTVEEKIYNTSDENLNTIFNKLGLMEEYEHDYEEDYGFLM